MADRAGGMPVYPIAFTLVQAQALNAVRCVVGWFMVIVFVC